MTGGVPSGSVLGPLLFLVYMDHVTSFLNCGYRIFAGDIKLYFSFIGADAQTRSSLRLNIKDQCKQM